MSITYTPQEEVTKRAQRVSYALIVAALQQDTSSPEVSIAELARATKYSRSSVSMALKDLEEGGRWKIQRGRGGLPPAKRIATSAHGTFTVPEGLTRNAMIEVINSSEF